MPKFKARREKSRKTNVKWTFSIFPFLGRIFIIFGQHLAIYTVVYKESESEVKKCKILEPGGKN